MKLSFPVEEDQGLDSEIYSNFGDAPGFILFDTETEDFKYIDNADLNHTPNNCNPLNAFGGEEVDAVILNGIGPVPLKKLQAAGIQGIRAGIGNVRENIELFKTGALICLTVNLSCGSKNVSCMCDCS
ncbi:Dinitrogenase iron-molybdenum cofactor biosynthesis protein [Denitrovibrio acetiphilus DSM 12809]|uniref:Dinitrogenase iron-molybdenum cofactor biosynthesis protein n=1 Tax=Denitrovibrio acetiphilus (strain DSM 12809 / NBRC 114555 / N2460) TaxID=522772 RepID=D4H3J9_DENA2|nr:NifB/NifX family molybdenum-iron cluster-binding protein [Denitrovibrio acetiphilus]ADD69101.1 Dinitrogenase iron-molybdenum cofactor biosynthesis protein [Denitrovibrio acetiphilus DSM 12809]